MTRRNKFITSILGIASSAALIFGYASGPDPRYTAAPGDDPKACSTSGCHTGTDLNAGGGHLVGNFPNCLSYTPGVQQTLTIVFTDALPKRYRFQFTPR